MGKAFKPLLIAAIVFASISFGALIGVLATLQTYHENLYIYLTVAGISAFIAIALTIMLLIMMFKKQK